MRRADHCVHLSQVFQIGIADVLGDWGSEGQHNRMTATEMQAMQAALDPLLAEAKGSGSKVSQFSEIARMITEPFFSAGQLWPKSQGTGGQVVYGAPNPRLF